MSGRFCKTCVHLRRIEGGIYAQHFRCAYEVTVPAPWPAEAHIYKPNFVISPRHAVPGNEYPEVLGSTQDWTEEMDCPTWKGGAA